MNKNEKSVESPQFQLFDDLPTSTVHQARLQVFEPTRRPKLQTREIATPWGSAIVMGKLGQAHADVLESIFSQADDWKQMENGSVQVLVDPYRVRTTASGGKQGSYEQLNTLVNEIMAAVIEMNVPARNMKIKGHVIDEVAASKITKKSRLGNVTGSEERQMWRVTVSRSFMQLIGGDLRLHYDPKPIAQLTTGIAQAVARHVATHSQQPPGGWHIDGLIKAVGAGKDSIAIRNRRRELLGDSEGLKNLGLLIEDGRIRRK